nr:phospholipase D-like domain-containing protein [Candidatus Krumholzibacteria bacterium]
MTTRFRFLLTGWTLALLLPLASFGQEVGSVRFLESFPEETSLDQSDLAQAWQTWPEIMAAATGTIDVASFYYSRQGDGKDAKAPAGIGDRLLPTLASLPKAALRGCEVRVLGDTKFQKTYPEALAWLDAQPGITSRAIDCPTHWGGGVMHAKYFVVDEQILYVGSQNWDWRAMNQIR